MRTTHNTISSPSRACARPLPSLTVSWPLVLSYNKSPEPFIKKSAWEAEHQFPSYPTVYLVRSAPLSRFYHLVLVEQELTLRKRSNDRHESVLWQRRLEHRLVIYRIVVVPQFLKSPPCCLTLSGYNKTISVSQRRCQSQSLGSAESLLPRT